MFTVPPKSTIYVGGKDSDNEYFYSALYLETLTVNELLKKLTEAFGIDLGLFERVFLIGPKGILVHFTDTVVRNLKTESVFQFSVRATAQSESARSGFDVLFEEVTSVINADATHGSPTAGPASTSNSN